MADLLLRNVREELVKLLKRRAARHDRSVEAEQCLIFEQTLIKTRRRSLAEVLAAIPEVGEDTDFERQ